MILWAIYAVSHSKNNLTVEGREIYTIVKKLPNRQCMRTS